VDCDSLAISGGLETHPSWVLSGVQFVSSRSLWMYCLPLLLKWLPANQDAQGHLVGSIPTLGVLSDWLR